MHASIERGTDLRTVLLEMGLLSAEEIDEVLDVLAMTRGGVLSSSLDRAREK